MAQVFRWLALAVFALAVVMPAVAQRQPSRSPHGPLAIPCENCHTSTGWVPIRAIPEFNHDSTRYPLRGMHEKVSCTGCHTKPVFTDVGKNCSDCHADIHRAQFGKNCAQCHTVLGWKSSVQAIEQHFNRFPLLGAHAVVQCDQCHKNAGVGTYLGLSTACESCHKTDFQQTTNPAHAAISRGTGPLAAQFQASNCTNCHNNFDTWFNAKFDHSVTGFLLTAGHANVACAACHINNNYNLTTLSTDCGNSGCHLTTWQQTNNPAHASAPNSFPIATCSTCHTTAGWSTTTFDHSTTGFPLTLGHNISNCAACHLNNNYSSMPGPRECGNSNCHLTKWNQTTTPVHSKSGPGFASANCANCHTPAGWTSAAFDHSVTGFTLIGTHMSTPCASCHTGSNPYSLTNADCYTSNCHLNDFLRTQTIGGVVPNHVASGFPTASAQCATCHPITTWAAGTFNHSAFGFDLTFGHAGVACALCHVGGNYSLQIAATACGTSGCHLITWQQTTNPAHMAAPNSFPIATCSSCHTTQGWTSAGFNHATTGFALTGMHVSPTPTPCASCHYGPAPYSLSSAACINCHLDKWQSTTTLGGSVPNHIAVGYPQTCESCHTTLAWTGAVFNHATTGFPLTGAHIATACNLCHTSSAKPSTLCYSCHLDKWQSTTTLGGSVPNHITAGYPTTCESCHTTTNWLGAVFNHATTGFPLVGAHTSTACTLCHLTAAKPPIDCYSCHTVAWQSTANLGGTVPNHLAADAAVIGIIAANCSSCHTPLAPYWLGATFSHPFFPLNHGGNAAQGVCAACHTSTLTTYTAFQCTVCHGGNVAANFKHPSVGGRYVYNSVACYGCHPNAP